MENYLGEIRIFAGTFAPRGWYLCNGQLLSISANEALFSLIGTTYGGNGVSTFALPDLRGRIPNSQFQGPGLSNYALGQAAGSEEVTLISSNAGHTHSFVASTTPGSTDAPGSTVTLSSLGTTGKAYLPGGTSGITVTPLSSSTIGNAGGSQPHNNIMPTVSVNFIIANQGIYPTQN